MVTPIIFVPGVMGSRLKMPSGSNWDPDSWTTMGSWALLQDNQAEFDSLSVDLTPNVGLLTTFNSPSLIENNPLLSAISKVPSVQSAVQFYAERGWTTISWNFYEAILIALETTFNAVASPFIVSIDHPVYAFGYDWRQSNATSGQKLVSFIDAVLAKHPGATDVVLVTHSMGGLVARAAYLDSSVVNKVRGVVHVTQPSNGSVTAYRRFFTGCISQYDKSPSPNPGSVDELIDVFFKWKVGITLTETFDVLWQLIVGRSPAKYARLMSGMPGPMELLPNHRYHLASPQPWLVTGSAIDLSKVYDLYAEALPPGILSPNLNRLVRGALQLRLSTAKTFHEQLGGHFHPNTFVLYSTSLRTDESIEFTPLLKVNQRENGDGTVHNVSGSCPDLPQDTATRVTFCRRCEHSKVFESPNANFEVIKFVKCILHGQADLSSTEKLGLFSQHLHGFLTSNVLANTSSVSQIPTILPRASDLVTPVVQVLEQTTVLVDDPTIITSINTVKTQLQTLSNQLSPTTPPQTSTWTDVTEAFLQSIATVNFSNGDDINAFFKARTNQDFVDWFNTHIAGKGAWKGKSIRKGFEVHQRFVAFWNNISVVYGTESSSSTQIGLIQFVTLMSIFINERGGDLVSRSEGYGRPDHPGVAYLFDSFSFKDNSGRLIKKASYNHTPNIPAGKLFRDQYFIEKHGGLALGPQLSGTTDAIWDGSVYPQALFPTSGILNEMGFILQADFFKFRGRGLIQTTWRANYIKLVQFIQGYSGTNAVINRYKAQWQGKASDLIATESTDAEWDDLFNNTDLIICCQAICLHSQSSGNYLVMNITADDLNRTDRMQGSIYYTGLRIGGTDGYGRTLKQRVVQILNALGN